MCLSAEEINPLCDECFVKYKEDKIESDDDLCQFCRAYMKCFCWCCFTEYESPEEAGIVASLCRQCREAS